MEELSKNLISNIKGNTITLNTKDFGINEGIICIQPPFNVEPSSHIEVDTSKLIDINNANFELSFNVLCGGRHTFYVWEKNNKATTIRNFNFYINKPGYFSGDTHSHSIYSDGKGTIEENGNSMKNKGHSFLICTDHNTINQKEEIDKLSKVDDEFLYLLSWEYTTSFGHMVIYNDENIIDKNIVNERNSVNQWQNVVDAIGEGGFSILAHPYEAPVYYHGDDIPFKLKGYSGIEVWNGFNHHGLSWQNLMSRKLWDILNTYLGLKLSGNAVTDSHSHEQIGNVFIKGFLNENNKENVYNMLKNGNYFGSNGPEIYFKIDGKSLGEVVHSQGKKLVNFTLTVFDPSQTIENIIIYKGKQKVGEKILTKKSPILKYKEFFPQGSDKTRFETNFYDVIEKGEFYRVEVISSIGIIPYSSNDQVEEKGFAFSNPIWIE